MAASTSVATQELIGPSATPYMSEPKPSAAKRKPGRSKRPGDFCGTDWRKTIPKMNATAPMGRLTKKTQRHDRSVTRRPPSTGPMAGARAVGVVRMLAARTRSAGGKTRKSMAIPTGASIPPPTPWRIRNSTSWVMLAANPQRAEATVKITIAASSTCFPPNRSPSHPEAGMNTARLTR